MLKRQILTVHRWLGLVLFAPLLLQTITGLMLIYRWPLAQWMDPQGMLRATDSADYSAGQVVERVAATRDDLRLQRLYFPPSAGGTFFLLLVDSEGERHYASIDPGNGHILREGSHWQFPVEAALQLHFQPLPGRAGNGITLLTGSGLLALLVAGIIAWWPHRGRWRQSLAFRTDVRRRLLLRQFHRSLGVLLLPVLAVIAATGCLMALELVLQSQGTGAQKALQRSTTVTGEVVDEAVSLAQSITPGARLRDISFAGDSVKVQFHAPERNARAVHSILIGGQPLRLIRHTPAQDNKAWWVILLPIHSGDILLPWGNRIVLAAGFCLLSLCGLGAWLWLPDRARRR